MKKLMRSIINAIIKGISSILKYLLMRSIIILCTLSLFLIVAGITWDIANFYKTPIYIQTSPHSVAAETSKQTAIINIKSGQNIELLSALLAEKGIITKPFYFKWLARLTGQAQQLKVGEYEINATMRPQDILNLFTSGRVIQYNFTIVDGWNFKQVRQALELNPNLTKTLTQLTDAQIMNKIGFGDVHPEGRFLPDTYFFPKGYSDEQILKRSFNAMNAVAQTAWQNRDTTLPIHSIEELLTLASIIEKETGIASERPQIAGVFVRRLEKNMRLQTDPTVIYGAGVAYNGTITRAQLDTDTPYNTYTRNGLPPTPIAMPSRAAIFAAANPQSGNSLYFVAKGDGSGAHIFSATLEAHNKAVQSYRRTRGQ